MGNDLETSGIFSLCRIFSSLSNNSMKMRANFLSPPNLLHNAEFLRFNSF
jgi:hypothetical protein